MILCFSDSFCALGNLAYKRDILSLLLFCGTCGSEDGMRVYPLLPIDLLCLMLELDEKCRCDFLELENVFEKMFF